MGFRIIILSNSKKQFLLGRKKVVKKTGKKKKYSVLSNYRFVFGELKRVSGIGAIALCAVSVLLQILLPFAVVALPSAIVALLTSGRKPWVLLTATLGYALFLQVLRTLSSYLQDRCSSTLFLFRPNAINPFWEACLGTDYEVLESEEGKEKWGYAMAAVYGGNEESIEGFVNNLLSETVQFCGMFVYAVILAMLHPLLLLLILLFCGIITGMNVWSTKKQEKIQWYEYNRELRAMRYLREETLNTANGKDIRLYRMKRWMMQEFEETIQTMMRLWKRMQNYILADRVVERLLTLVRDAVVYAYLIWRMAQGTMEVSVFLLYVGVAAGFGGFVSGFFNGMEYILHNQNVIKKYREFLDMSAEQKMGTEQIPAAGALHEIRFEHVCYRYEGQETDTLKDLNFTIHPGEKLALVGVNGAGKTTLIKLLCGLYHPTSGRIMLDGKDISAFSQREYFKEFSAVFQDVFTFAFPLADNVSCQSTENTDMERLEDCLKKANLWERVRAMPKGVHTMMNKDLDAEGVVLSGGEMQKLMLARVLYKEAPVIILDEPTAALDPVAESELYEKYYDLIHGKTSIFISHRLSSTRFCDRILFMEDGKIVEEGDHETLMNKHGAYANMYEVQAKYYKEKQEQEEECYA